ncbi:MAG: biopolymer transporter ExbD [endosymbiont of Galathealinum brachiosum]|uniref:Biopolymer transporter ExbD n=1 Tax=endosymbiont of Galathealinum brachiosum TaxID=2200906 RepID=A0A370DDY3_9GAMM|nr:MAG: biopolymer transporter ExbD [endosymbiont of Galathealinum brachiosum]
MPARRHKRIKKSTQVELDITAFMNLMVVLVPFLLMSAVFTSINILDLKLPGMGESKPGEKKPDFELQVTVRKNALDLSDTQGGMIKHIPITKSGYNFVLLNQTLRLIKFKFPEKTNISILSEPYTSYETLVQVMDSVREFKTLQDGEVVVAELFPAISIGDAAKK